MAERRPKNAELERVLGTGALFSTAYGNVGSSIYYALGLVAGFALGLTPIVFLITGAIFFCTAATYAEATAMFPEAGGSSSFARRAFNEFWSFFAAWGQMLNYVITIAISAFFVPHYIGGLFWDELKTAPGDIIGGALVIVLLAAINVVGVKESAGLNIFLAVVDFLTQVLLVAIGAVLVLSPDTLADNVQWGIAPTWENFIISIPLGMIAYTGIETISNMAEEARDEATTIPRSINRVRIAVFAIYFTLPAVALSALPVTQRDGEYQSLLVYSMGIHRQLPDGLRRLHPRYRTPWIGIIVFSGVAILTLLPGQADFLGLMYAFGAMLSFTIAHASVIRLRFKLPGFARPYRGPGNAMIRGRDVPLFAVVGGTATAGAFLATVALNPDVAVAG